MASVEVTKAYLKEVADRARAGLQRYRTEQREAFDYVKRIVEVGAGSFAIGWYHGRKGAMRKFFGVPLDALAGGALLAVGMMRFEGASDIGNLGLGVFSYWTGNLGAQLGQRMRKSAGELVGSPYPVDANGNALGADGKPLAPAMQVRTITAGGMPYGAAPAFAPSMHTRY